ncbi:hypothetical protein CC2G_004231 [Coprinopsis cinerea AmutBmut pab1-1]|nr:hypothetical protein CC2G_004231 [Coprinopsis cinerea AmutBmut pab1-1]
MLFYGFWWSLELPFSSKNIISIPYDYPVGCLAFIAPEARSRTLILWIPTVVGSFLFLAFTMYRFFESIRDDDGTLNLKNCLRPKNISPIMIILAQDGARCYFVILVTTALRAVFLYHYAGVYPMIMHWHLVIYCTASSRLVLILRAGAGLPTKFVSGLPEQSRLDFKKATTNTTNWDSTLPTDTRLVFNYSLNTKGANGNGVA